jgi:hypothetical protein
MKPSSNPNTTKKNTVQNGTQIVCLLPCISVVVIVESTPEMVSQPKVIFIYAYKK